MTRCRQKRISWNCSEARRTRLDAAIDLGLAQLDKAELELARTEIHAPIDGVITREGPEQGGYVQRGGTVAVVQDTSSMEIRCSLPMQQMNWLWQSDRGAGDLVPIEQRVPVAGDAGHGRVRHGNCYDASGRGVWPILMAPGRSADTMVPCRVVVKNPREMTFEGEVTRQPPSRHPSL